MAFFVAFYSYKGGVGRTLALANVACALARRGKRVILIDMDLEAPALLSFPEFALKGTTPKRGFLEYAAVYSRDGECPSIDRYVHACQRNFGAGKLWVMPSGRGDVEYQDALARLSWRCLHPEKGTPPFVDGLRKAMTEELKPHYVLIDSRTGLSDVGGLSTHLLADMVVLVFNLSKECIEGSVRAYRAFASESTSVHTIQLVASPVPPASSYPGSLVEERIRKAAAQMLRSNGEVVRVSYDPLMVLSEELAVLKPAVYAASEKYEKLRQVIQEGHQEEVFPVLEEARRLRSENRWEDGFAKLRTFAEEHSDDLEVHMAMGGFLLEAGRAEEAVECFQTATELAPELAVTHRNLGEAHLAAKEVDEAVASLERARQLEEHSRETFEALAKAYQEKSAEAQPESMEFRRKSAEAQRGALSVILEDMERASVSGNEDLQDLRDDFVTAVSQSGFDAVRAWELLRSSRAMSSARKQAVARAFIHGGVNSYQAVAMIRMLQQEVEEHSADLEIRITTEAVAGGTRIRYVLHSAEGRVGYTHCLVGETVIGTTIDQYMGRIFTEMNLLKAGRSSDGAPLVGDEVAIEMAALGRELYDRLLPQALKNAYRTFRNSVMTILLVSDEPWIPWELIKPYDEGLDDDFLCCQFEITRWLAGKIPPAMELRASQVVCVESGDVEGMPPLPHSIQESQLITGLSERFGAVGISVIDETTHQAVMNLLRVGGHGLIHFVGHSATDSDDPRLLLTDGRAFRPRDLHGEVRTRIRRDRPLVFLNSSIGTPTTSQMGDWVTRWLDCGSGAFIGPLWDVGDKEAYLFAKSFYEALERGETIGRAVRAARLRVREESPGRTDWLAYTAYAHPNARLRLGTEPASETGV